MYYKKVAKYSNSAMFFIQTKRLLNQARRNKVAKGTDHGAPMRDFMHDVQRTAVQQDDYRGIGGHPLQEHGPHGPHTQVNIGLGNGGTATFRDIDAGKK